MACRSSSLLPHYLPMPLPLSCTETPPRTGQKGREGGGKLNSSRVMEAARKKGAAKRRLQTIKGERFQTTDKQETELD